MSRITDIGARTPDGPIRLVATGPEELPQCPEFDEKLTPGGPLSLSISVRLCELDERCLHYDCMFMVQINYHVEVGILESIRHEVLDLDRCAPRIAVLSSRGRSGVL